MLGNGNVGIGDSTPAAALTVGDNDKFQVDSNGAVKPAVYSGVMTGESGISYGALTNTWTATTADSRFFMIDLSAGNDVVVRADGNVGIGETDPSQALVVGSGNDFQVDSTGNILSVRSVSYSWPISQGGVSSVLVNDGSGNLTWGSSVGTVDIR